MFSLHTLLSLMRQIVGAAPDPAARFHDRGRPRPGSRITRDGCGCCPRCRAFVYVRFSGPGLEARCPSCAWPIDHLDPLGSADDGPSLDD